MTSSSSCFSPAEFLRIAQGLFEAAEKSPPDFQQALYRAAIGRAYYAAFLTVREYLGPNPTAIPTGKGAATTQQNSNQNISVHKDAISELKQLNSTDGDTLDELRKHRVSADYKLKAYLTLKVTQECLENASFLIESYGPSAGS